MQLYFRVVKRPGESHLALDGKKPFIKVDVVPPFKRGPPCSRASTMDEPSSRAPKRMEIIRLKKSLMKLT
jgi:hypothetical protein